MSQGTPITILIADDDPEDLMLAKRAMHKAHLANEVRSVEDGEQLLDYLRGVGAYAGAPRPGIILLDLNMPRKDGREALREIKADPALRAIPVVILTTSKAEEDILRSYDLGASSFITKPVSFEGLVEVMATIQHYWLQIVELPGA